MNNTLLSIEKRENYLWVEGSDDKHVFIGLLNYHQITDPDPKLRDRFKANKEQFQIKDHDGIQNLLSTLKVELKGDVEYRRYGIVVDADTSIENTWRSLKDILDNAGYTNVPSIPMVGGTVIKQDGLPTLGLWLMPDNVLPGIIEDFISFLGPKNDELWPVAENVVEQVITTKCNFRPSYKSKVLVHTWLAWQEEPGRPMGQAITQKYIDAVAPHALELINWFRQLFELPPP